MSLLVLAALTLLQQQPTPAPAARGQQQAGRAAAGPTPARIEVHGQKIRAYVPVVLEFGPMQSIGPDAFIDVNGQYRVYHDASGTILKIVPRDWAIHAELLRWFDPKLVVNPSEPAPTTSPAAARPRGAAD